MTRRTLFTATATAVAAGAIVAVLSLHVFADNQRQLQPLPEAKEEGPMSLEKALAMRRSVRQYTSQPVTAEQIAQLCWAAQGITEPKRGFRTAPSAGATYPLELYVVTADGVARYEPQEHAIERHLDGDLRQRLAAAAKNQSSLRQAPVIFVFAGVIERTTARYGERAERYVWMEAGHAAQNLLLAATAMDLGAVPVGAFRDEQVATVLSLPEDHRPLYILPVGQPRKEANE